MPVVPPQAPPPPVVPNTAFSLGQPYFETDPRKTGENYLASLAFADTISAFDERIQFIGGLRSQRVMTKTFQANTGIETNAYDSHRLSPAYALIVKPFDNRLSLYANYIEGLSQGLRVTNPLATNYNETYPPFVSKQIETGAKLDLGILANTLSFYEITQPTLSTVTSGGLISYKPVQQRNQGIEWNVFGEPIPGVRVLGGVTYMIGVITQSADGKTTGKNAFGIPRWQANFYGEWDLPYLVGVTVEGRVIYTSALYVDSLNYYRIPEWARFDAGASLCDEDIRHGHDAAGECEQSVRSQLLVWSVQRRFRHARCAAHRPPVDDLQLLKMGADDEPLARSYSIRRLRGHRDGRRRPLSRRTEPALAVAASAWLVERRRWRGAAASRRFSVESGGSAFDRDFRGARFDHASVHRFSVPGGAANLDQERAMNQIRRDWVSKTSAGAILGFSLAIASCGSLCVAQSRRTGNSE